MQRATAPPTAAAVRRAVRLPRRCPSGPVVLSVRAAIFVCAVLLLCAGCATPGERRASARAEALRFERALGERNVAGLCAALAPGTREELTRSAGTNCREGILEEDLPPAGEVRRVDVHGRQARVVFAADTLFLSRFSGDWRVVAAGCEPRPGRPYQCSLKGG